MPIGQSKAMWQEQQETKEVALANLTLHTQRIPKDNNPITTDNANRAIQGNAAMQITQPGGQL